MWLEHGDWLANDVRNWFPEVDVYPADRGRHKNIGRNAPRLGLGNKIVKVVVPTLELLTRLLAAYDGLEIPDANFVRVPYYVESDGSKTHFLPGLRDGMGYRIGEKGSERLVVDYWEALAAVLAMPMPRFRRRNAEGNAGIVACRPEQQEEVSRRVIEAEIARLKIERTRSE